MSIKRKSNTSLEDSPREIFREEFLRPMKISAYALAKQLHVPAPRINDIVLEKPSITAATAVRLARFFGTSEQFWLNLQAACDVSRVKAERAAELAHIKPLNANGACP
jgi:antitoxin HigA-1